MPEKKQIPHFADSVRNDKMRVFPQPSEALPSRALEQGPQKLKLRTENYFFPPLAWAVTLAISAAMA
jgi:hypothetical protein